MNNVTSYDIKPFNDYMNMIHSIKPMLKNSGLKQFVITEKPEFNIAKLKKKRKHPALYKLDEVEKIAILIEKYA